MRERNGMCVSGECVRVGRGMCVLGECERVGRGCV